MRFRLPQTTGTPAVDLPLLHGAVALLLWGIFLIKLPLIVACGLLLGLFCALQSVAITGSVDRISGLVLANLLFWLLSGLLCGALTMSMLSQPGYYSNEGRVFINYLPFLILSSCVVGRSTLRLTIRHIRWMALAGLVLYAIWSVRHLPLLSVGRAHNFAGFLTSHTGSGTFFAELCIFLLIFGLRTRRRMTQLLGLAMLLPVLGSGSREALVALVAVLLWYLRRRIFGPGLLVAVGLIAGLAWIMPTVSPHTYERVAEMFRTDTLRNIQAQLESTSSASWEPGQDRNLSGEQFNILSRVLYWSYAVRHFADSPFIGAGFGRFNDRDVRFVGVEGLVYVGVSAQNSAATLNAHNSYLQLLQETGLVGLFLLLAVWAMLWRRVSRARRDYADDPELLGYFEAMHGLIVFLLVAALFGHALGAPIDGIPVLCLLGLGLAYDNGRRRAWHLAIQPQIWS
ncbi:MAG TPA: O-antigen ligase family protein, partial [Solimonas sp.]|nr:O-antigen ligase family protein [Solimonas sp.]